MHCIAVHEQNQPRMDVNKLNTLSQHRKNGKRSLLRDKKGAEFKLP